MSTVRDTAFLLSQRAGMVLGGLAFAAIVPRLMGPEAFGQYALLVSLALWFSSGSGVGLVSTVGRYLPGLRAGDPAHCRAFLGNLLLVRLVTAVAASSLYFVLLAAWLPEFDGSLLGMMAAVVAMHALATFVPSLFLGLQQPARWGLFELLRRWLLLALIVPFVALAGLPGAAAAFLVTDAVLLGLALAWTHASLGVPDLRPDLALLRRYVGGGAVLSASHLLFAALQASGEVLVRLIHVDYAEVAYFGVAHAAYLAVALSVPQVGLALVARLGPLADAGDVVTARRWGARLVGALAAAAAAGAFAMVLVGDHLVALVLGPAYAPVAANLVPLALALVPLSLGVVGISLATLADRPGILLSASTLRLAVFWTTGPILVHQWASYGACLALLLAATVHAAFLSWQLPEHMLPAVRTTLSTLGVSLAFVPLVLLRSSPPADIVVLLVGLAGYGLLLRAARLLTADDLVALGAAIGVRGRTSGHEC